MNVLAGDVVHIPKVQVAMPDTTTRSYAWPDHREVWPFGHIAQAVSLSANAYVKDPKEGFLTLAQPRLLSRNSYIGGDDFTGVFHQRVRTVGVAPECNLPGTWERSRRGLKFIGEKR